MIGYYYDPKAVIEQLWEWPFIAIRGNHERMFQEALRCRHAADSYYQTYGSGIRVAAETLSQQQIDWLVALPDRTSLAIDGMSLELCHGSPLDRDLYVYPDAPGSVLESCVVADRDGILLGHTHYPMMVVRGKTLIVNPGSVGQSRDLGGFASWCLLDTANRTFRFFRTAYDAISLSREVRERDPHLLSLASVLTKRNPYAEQLRWDRS